MVFFFTIFMLLLTRFQNGMCLNMFVKNYVIFWLSTDGAMTNQKELVPCWCISISTGTVTNGKELVPLG